MRLKKGDRVAAYVPNKIETVISFLACAKNGIIWSSCSPDFGVQGVVDRFKQIEPKVFITSDYYFYNGKKINILDKVDEVLKQIPSIEKVIVYNYFKKKKKTLKILLILKRLLILIQMRLLKGLNLTTQFIFFSQVVRLENQNVLPMELEMY